MIDGSKIKEMRLERGLTLQEVGNLMGGIPSTTVHQMERQAQSNAKVETLLRLCVALNCTLEDLLTDGASRSYQKLATRKQAPSSWRRQAAGLKKELKKLGTQIEFVTRFGMVGSNSGGYYLLPRKDLANLLLAYRHMLAWQRTVEDLGISIDANIFDPTDLILSALGIQGEQCTDGLRELFDTLLFEFNGTSVDEALSLFDSISRKWLEISGSHAPSVQGRQVSIEDESRSSSEVSASYVDPGPVGQDTECS